MSDMPDKIWLFMNRDGLWSKDWFQAESLASVGGKPTGYTRTDLVAADTARLKELHNEIAAELWGHLMQWCKKRGVAPANYNDLFQIVAILRERGDTPK